MIETVTRTTCAYCGVGCGVLAVKTADGIAVRGDPEHPSGAGRLCSKGSALADTLGSNGRLLHPRIHHRDVDRDVDRNVGRNVGRDAGWDEALDLVAARFADTIATHGPDSVAFYVSGQMLTEDYYVANKLMKGFLGSANIDTNSRLCMSSAVIAHQRAFGEDLVPGCYEDLEETDLLVLVGSNTAWCHPVLWRRIEDARRHKPSMRIVVIDPRRTPTCELADLHLALRSGSDVTLFNGLLAYLHREGCADEHFLAAHTGGAGEALAAARAGAHSIADVAASCGLDPRQLEEFYRLFAANARVVTAFSQGVNQSSSGSDKASSIINCHLLTGRIGKPGAGPFSLTGQPNAMGGREVGGMAGTLAAHMRLDSAADRFHVQEFWASPRIASRHGLKAVDMFDAVGDGRIKALWIMATNPAVSLPDADRVRDAIARCDFVVVSDCVADTDTTRLAHVLLPAQAWGEKDGTTTNSERRISRQRAFVPPVGDAKPDWWIVSQVARRLGFGAAFAYEAPHAIFDEHARLSTVGNDGTRAFDIGGLAGLSAAEYDELESVRWPVRRRGEGSARLFADGKFFHGDGRAHLVATPPEPPAHATCKRFPFVLNTGRLRDQWHTMTRTGLSPRLAEHSPEPFVDLHADDAEAAGITDGDLVKVSTRWGSVVVRPRISGDVRRGNLFVPIHWSAANSSDGRVGALVNPVVDPRSGEPEFKHTPAAIERITPTWHGLLATRDEHRAPDVPWWTKVEGDGFRRYELGGVSAIDGCADLGRRLLRHFDTDVLEYVDEGAGVYRGAVVVGGRLEACVFLSARSALPPRGWVAELFAMPSLDVIDRQGLLAARPIDGGVDPGRIVCSCFQVGESAILDAIEKRGLTTAAEVGTCVKAGTNCGSCLVEIRTLLHGGAAACGRSA